MSLMLTLLGIAYSVTLAFIGLEMIGSCGVGTGVFAGVAFYPYGLGLLFWPVVGFLLSKASEAFYRMMILAITTTHYVVLTIFLYTCWAEEYPRLMRIWRAEPAYIIESVAIYAIGQAFIWMVVGYRTLIPRAEGAI